MKAKLAQAGAGDLTSKAREIDGFKVLAAKVDGMDGGQMRTLVDSLRSKLGSGVVFLGGGEEGRVTLICGVTKDLAGKRAHAGKLLAKVAEKVGGRGGGRPDMAQGGGKNLAALEAALESVYDLAKE